LGREVVARRRAERIGLRVIRVPISFVRCFGSDLREVEVRDGGGNGLRLRLRLEEVEEEEEEE